MKSTKKQGGYIASLLGGVTGAILVLFISTLIIQGLFSQALPNSPGNQLLIITFIVLILTSIAEIIGCFLSLRWQGYQNAKKTALWLTALIIPGWLLLIFLRIFIDWFVAAILVIIALPLVARSLTNNPNYPGYLQKMLDVVAKRP
jgi:lysylphosphatidylglycerol synthetase-like protein (DUF2156 family)